MNPQPLLITTKFFPPPSPPQGVKRPHLVRRIEEGLEAHHPLILISAPAGYGKSALVAEWRESTRRTITWLSLDKSDNEPLRFLVYLIATLQKADNRIGTELMTLLEANQLPPHETIIALLTEDLLASKSSPVCVLDDFHAIQDPFILELLQSLIAHPLPLQFIILTREDPAIPLGRLRAGSRLTEIRAMDLRFSKEEAASFFREVMHIPLAERDLSLLEKRTEGWIAGLKLAGLSMQEVKDPSTVIASLSGSHRHILSFLTEEVLKQQSTSVQEFLLQTSILAKFNADLCNAVTQRKDSATRLEQLLASNLFLIPLDNEGCWYRYHHLFADLLFSFLNRSQGLLVKDLHIRASEWFANHSMPVEAIDHALYAKDFARAASLLETYTWTLLNQGYVRRIETWMQSLPSRWRAQSPRTNLGFAWMYLLRGNFGKVIDHLQQAEETLENAPERDDLRAEYLALKANLLQSQGRVPEAIENAREALRIASPTNDRVLGLANLGLGAGYRQAVQFNSAVEALQKAIRFSRKSGDSVTGVLAATHLILMSLQHGRLNLAEEVSSQIIEQIEHSGEVAPPIIGAIYGALGEVYYERNQVEQARNHYLRGIQLATFLGHHASLIYTKLNFSRLLLAEGNLIDAKKNLQDAQELIQAGAPDRLKPVLIAHQVLFLLAKGNQPEAEAILRQTGVTPEGQITHATDEIHLAYLLVMLKRASKADLQKGIVLAERILALAKNSQRNRTAMLALVLGSLIHARLQDLKSALSWLERALVLAEPEGYIRLFVDQGEEVTALLKQLPQTDYVQTLLAAFPSVREPDNQIRPVDGIIEPLSERELEVLHLLAQGLKYAEIAERMVVSTNTIRFHIKSIYGKLGVNKQVKAVERARKLGLIE